MPPRKKARLSSRPPSSASADTANETTPKATTPKLQHSTSEEAEIDLNDPWTDEQEIALLKAIVRNKPVGPSAHRTHAHTIWIVPIAVGGRVQADLFVQECTNIFV
jgi:hypothetical protein